MSATRGTEIMARTTETSDALSLIVEVAHEAGAFQLARRDDLVIERSKAHVNDIVSDIDIASEKLIVDTLLSRRPDDGVLGEEGNTIKGTSGWRWVIDPIDGTRNYVSGSGPWAVCIALEHNGKTQLAVVYDPIADDTFTAIAGLGAQLNGTDIRASSAYQLDQALLALTFNTSVPTKRTVGHLMPTILPAIGDIRRYPAALSLTSLAAGRVDSGLILDVKIWDVLAGYLIAREAGVILGGHSGEPLPGMTLAAGPRMWEPYTALVMPLLSKPLTRY